jgi:hypothetical protein
MKIINNADKQVEFVHIKVGECFMYDNCLFIKMTPVKNNEHAANAYCFVDNNIACVPQAVLVTPVDAEIIIHSKGAE